MIKIRTGLRIGILILAVSAGAFITRYFKPVSCPIAKSGISDFNDARDTADILKLMEEDRYWLISSKDYDPAFALKSRSPNTYEDKYKGKMKIRVMRKDGAFIGFVTYYMKNFIEGLILFLAVRSEFRGKRYGPELMDYALADLKCMGAQQAELVTRVSNVKAQSVYKRTGFEETTRDEEYIYYRKKL